tara:strand:+ start:113 stop:349 length:237 start_codon:yes stop_codon:yes gene_type:complete
MNIQSDNIVLSLVTMVKQIDDRLSKIESQLNLKSDLKLNIPLCEYCNEPSEIGLNFDLGGGNIVSTCSKHKVYGAPMI